MALLNNTAEGLTNGTAVTTPSQTGGASGDAFNAINHATNGTITASTAQKAHGTVSYHVVTDTATTAFMEYDDAANSTQFAARFYIYFNALPGASARFFTMRSSAGNIFSLTITGSNRIYLGDTAGASLATFPTAVTTGVWYRFEVYGKLGASATTGSLFVGYYTMDSTTPRDPVYDHSGTSDVNLGTSALTAIRYGKVDTTGTSALDAFYDDVACNPGSFAAIGPVSGSSTPTAAFTTASIGTDGIFDASGSAAVSPATISTYAWDFGDTNTGSGVNPTHKYATAGTYTVQLTVTDSNGATASTSHTITITAPGSTGSVRSTQVTTGWTVVPSGTAQAALSDTSGGNPVLTSFLTSGVAPSAQELDVQLDPIAPPASGQPLIVTVYIDRINSTTGTLNAQIFEGATQRASLSNVAIPDMASSGGTGDASSGAVGSGAAVVLNFPYSSVSAVTDWNQLVLKLQVTVA